jgi:hypothetical protein
MMNAGRGKRLDTKMKLLASFIVLVLLGPMTYAQTNAPSTLGLEPDQIPPDCKAVKGDFPVDFQAGILWEKPDLYKGMMPAPVAKGAQSFDCHGERGTVYLFQFGSEAERKTAGAFIKGVLWGEPRSTEDHPELVLESSDVLTVISFRKAPKSLLTAFQTGKISRTARQLTAPGGDFPIPGHGSLRLKVPDGWGVQSKQIADPASVTLHVTPASGSAFDIYVTAVWLNSERLPSITSDWLRQNSQAAADKLSSRAVEKVATLHDLRGLQSTGFYYALTDRESKPGEYAYLTQGMLLTGELLTTFTILHRTPESSEVTQALGAIADATYVK